MKFENYEKWDMVVYFIKSDKNVEAASNLYYERLPNKLINSGRLIKECEQLMLQTETEN